MSKGMKIMFQNPTLYTTALKFAPLANSLPSFLTGNKLNVWCKHHAMPQFAKKSFHEMWKKGEVK